MLELQLSAKIRETFGKQNKALRKSGSVPAVLYGHGVDTVSLTLDSKEFAKIYKKAGESTIVNLNIEDKGKTKEQPIIINEIGFDPVTDQIIHADLYAVRMDEKITANIPLVFIGESDAVKMLGGILIKNVHEVQVASLPKDLPHEIVVDISAIKTFADHICLKDLKLTAGAEIKNDLNEIVALVKPPRSEEELKALEGEVKIDVEAIKVESEEKKKEAAAKEEAEKVE